MRAGLKFFLGLLWRWEVVGAGATTVFVAGGISAIYGDDFILATFLFFLGIVWLTAKAVSWSEVKMHKDRVWVSLFIAAMAIFVFWGSLKWIQGRAVAEAKINHTNPAPIPDAQQATRTTDPKLLPPADAQPPKSESHRKKLQLMVPAPSLSTAVPPLVTPTQNCPNGICMGGDNNGTATVNNYAPPQRKLTKEERDKFVSDLRRSCPFEVAVRAIPGNAESMEYADQISAAIKDAGCTLKRAKFLIDTSPSYGVWLTIHDKDKIPVGADALAGSFNAANIPFKGNTGDFIEQGSVYVMVGLNDSKPQ
jgi:hypothetical protein